LAAPQQLRFGHCAALTVDTLQRPKSFDAGRAQHGRVSLRRSAMTWCRSGRRPWTIISGALQATLPCFGIKDGIKRAGRNGKILV